MKSQLTTKSERETIELAEKFLKEALKRAEENKSFDGAQDKPLVIWLEGELGAGKTQFAKGIAKALGIKEKITSPTFVLMKKFKILTGKKAGTVPASKGRSLFFHIDCYRIYDAEDARQIGLEDILNNHRAIVAIEWAERIANTIPRPYWEIKFEHAGDNKRRISIKNIR